MKKIFVLFFLSITFIGVSQEIMKLKKVEPAKDYDNILVQKLNSDDFQSSFVIWIKKEVKLHKHTHHTENIYVIEGKGEMRIGKETYQVKKGDYFNIPKNTPHALKVTSSKPMKVLSIQSPKFLGQDRIFIEE
ncbi:MAG: cupin domain-containing protein [Flavobacteriales bacterium]|jgi:quercetin dioxygenase-like cupin family protein|nr:cupin domain-containing protein [Flavobacteriales bacterium]